ncbi:hypothetical protein BX666DRAFT_2033379 [Dichotomocladium elegans]|nr:hypothetical protein BX666DRAFT_2033379 [Dichotomocladium elegans]
MPWAAIKALEIFYKPLQDRFILGILHSKHLVIECIFKSQNAVCNRQDDLVFGNRLVLDAEHHSLDAKRYALDAKRHALDLQHSNFEIASTDVSAAVDPTSAAILQLLKKQVNVCDGVNKIFIEWGSNDRSCPKLCPEMLYKVILQLVMCSRVPHGSDTPLKYASLLNWQWCCHIHGLGMAHYIISRPSVLYDHIVEDDTCLHNVFDVFLRPQSRRLLYNGEARLQYTEGPLDILSCTFLGLRKHL